MDTDTNTNTNTEQIVKDLKTVAHSAEELVKATASEVSEKARDARVRLAAALETAKQTCQRLEEKAIKGAEVTDKAIREHPYQSLSAAFVVGLLLGVLVAKK